MLRLLLVFIQGGTVHELSSDYLTLILLHDLVHELLRYDILPYRLLVPLLLEAQHIGLFDPFHLSFLLELLLVVVSINFAVRQLFDAHGLVVIVGFLISVAKLMVEAVQFQWWILEHPAVILSLLHALYVVVA